MKKEIYFFPSQGTAGAVAMITLAPWLAAIGVIAGIITRCKIEVEKSPEP